MYTQHGTWFDALQLVLNSAGDGDLSADLCVDIPTPILHCVLARRRVLALADKHDITPSTFKPNSTEPEPVLPAFDFSTPQLKTQKAASDITKRAEFLSPRSAAAAAGLRDVVARLDDCHAMGAGAFLRAIPGGRNKSGRFFMQGDHRRVAARCHIGLPSEGVIPATRCVMCGERWDKGVLACGCATGRAAIHASVCSRGASRFKNRRHDAAADVLLAMYESIGGTGAVDHKKQLNAAGTATLGSACTVESGARVDVILYAAGPAEEDIALDVSFVCAEAHGGFEQAVLTREGDKNKIYIEGGVQGDGHALLPLRARRARRLWQGGEAGLGDAQAEGREGEGSRFSAFMVNDLVLIGMEAEAQHRHREGDGDRCAASHCYSNSPASDGRGG